MKIKMIEHYQDAQVILQPEQVADVDDTLGAWLVKHRKGYIFTEAQTEVAMIANVETETEQPAEVPVVHTGEFKRVKRSK